MHLKNFRKDPESGPQTPIDLERLGRHINVPFSSWPLEKAEVLWLNHRWFMEQKINTARPEVADSVISTILETFARTTVPQDGQTEAKHLAADLYGGSAGSIYPGSGRCGNSGQFNAKGVGQTPLVSSMADIHHSNGRMSLAEALREAVNAEVANSELPHGAVPIIAIIDTGQNFTIGDDAQTRRGAIVVRPNFVRPAHFERSIFPGDSGYKGADQYIDAIRVKDAVQASLNDPKISPSLVDMFTRFSQQIGAAHAKRLWQGMFLTSNLSVTGALVDFGAFRSVPDWRARVGLAGERFGSEIVQLRKALLSLGFYFAKYGEGSMQDFDIRDLMNSCADNVRKAFSTTCLNGLGLDDQDDRAQALGWALLEYFQAQQSMSTSDNCADLSGWLYDAFASNGTIVGESSREAALARHIVNSYRVLYDGEYRHSASLAKALQFLSPQPLLQYKIACKKAEMIERAIICGRVDPKYAVAGYIHNQFIRHRRTWKNLPRHLEIVDSGFSDPRGLLCLNLLTSRECFWIEAYRIDDEIVREPGSGQFNHTRHEPKVIGNTFLGYAIDMEEGRFPS